VAEQNNEFFIENHETCPISSTLFSKVNATTFDLYFRGHDSDDGHGHKGNFKDTFYHQKWNNNVKREKKIVKIMTNKMRI